MVVSWVVEDVSFRRPSGLAVAHGRENLSVSAGEVNVAGRLEARACTLDASGSAPPLRGYRVCRVSL